MLFPLYWMINVSLTQPTDLRKDPPNLFPVNPTSTVTARCSAAGAVPRTSLIVGLGTVVLTVALAGTGRLRAGEAAAARRDRGEASCC